MQIADNFRSGCKTLIEWWNDEEGLTVVEYVIGAALLVAVVAGVYANLGENLETSLENTVDRM